MNSTLASAQEAFAESIGHQPDPNAPIGQAEAAALRDRMKSLLRLLSAQETGVCKLDEQVQAMRSRIEDAEETAKQLRSLAIRVNDLVGAQKLIDSRLKVVEEKLGIVSFNTEVPIIEKKPRKKR